MKSKEYDLAVQRWHDNQENNICRNPSSKKFYSFFKKKMNSKHLIPPLYNEDGTISTSDKDKAHLLNSYFQKVYIKDDGFPLFLPSKTKNIMGDFTITSTDIIDSINTLNDKISRTPENIPSFFIKRIGSSIVPFLVPLFNHCLNQNVVPAQWKKAYITPVFKKGDQSKPDNYRPISLTSAISRLFEIIIHKKIINHFISNNLFSPKQFGFLPYRSSCAQMIQCLHDWCSNFSQGRQTHVLYTDISKAFDSVSHQKLICVLRSYGISYKLLDWLKNFLCERQQQVAINDSLSSPINISSGIPQGTILGPLLFLIYINDIDTCCSSANDNVKISLFADDAKLYGTDVNKLQQSFNQLGPWLEDRQLRLAPNKCFSLHLGKSNLSNPSFSFGNTLISSRPSIKDLGIFVSNNLKWSTHINYIYRNAMNSSYHILKFTKTKNIWTLLRLYKTYIRPKLEYNTAVWSPYLIKDIKKIEQIQKHYTRTIFKRCNIPFNCYSNRLYQLNIHSLQYRRVYFDLVFMFKIINGMSGLNFDEFFVYRTRPYNLRKNECKIDVINQYKSSTWNNSFFVRTSKLWNALPEDLTLISSLQSFKDNLNKFDLNSLVKLQYP